MEILVAFFGPLILATQSRQNLEGLFADLGVSLKLTDPQATTLRELMVVFGAVEDVADIAQEFAQTKQLSPDQLDDLLASAQAIFDAIETFKEPGFIASNAALPPLLKDATLWSDMALRLPDYLVTTWLEGQAPVPYGVLRALGVIIVRERVPATPGLPPETVINWDLLEAALEDPLAAVQDRYGWPDTPDIALMVENLLTLLGAFGLHPRVRAMRPSLVQDWMGGEAPEGTPELELPLYKFSQGAVRASMGLLVAPVGPGDGSFDGIGLTTLARGALNTSIPVSDTTALTIATTGNADRALDLRLRAQGPEFEMRPGTADISVSLNSEPEEPWRVFGSAEGMRFELARVMASLETSFDGPDSDLALRVTTMGATPGLRVVITTKGSDGFIADALGDLEFDITGDIGLRWSQADGLVLEGGAGFEVLIPLDVTFGPIRLDRVRIALAAGTQGLDFTAAVTGGLDVSVLAVSVEDIGLNAKIVPLPEAERPGLLGPLDLVLGFKPPTGIGLAINAGDLVTGGGYLFHDPARHEYAGVGQVSIGEFGLTAVGILVTELPDDPSGWSLFLAIFSEFPPIQIGFGMALSGVGGLIGLHRTFDDEALRSRLKSGALESLMFPADPVANAPQIIDDMRAVFPVSPGQFVVGALFRLSWGTPRIVTLDFGLIVEFPDPVKIAILARISMIFPSEENALVEINIDSFGVLNLTEGTFSMDGTVRDSHVLHLFQLSGDFALRIALGDNPVALASMGGFHPAFLPPPGIPKLARLKASLPLGEYAEVSLATYIAISSNSFQIGGRLDVWVKVSGFTAEGWLGFDALIQFSPFGFTFAVYFGVKVAKGSVTLMGVDVVATVTGPDLWTINGHAEFKFLGAKKKIKVNIEMGSQRSVSRPAYDVAALLHEALMREDAWEPVESATPLPVTLGSGAREGGGAVPLSPTARIRLRQSIAPLAEQLEKFGNGTVQGASEFVVNSLRLGSAPQRAPVSEDFVADWFAPAEYFDMGEDEKLASPSYVSMQAGVMIGSATEVAGAPLEHLLDWEEITVDPEMNMRARTSSTNGAGAALLGAGAQVAPEPLVEKGRFSLRPRAETRVAAGPEIARSKEFRDVHIGQTPRSRSA